MLRLLDQPQDIPVLASLIKRERLWRRMADMYHGYDRYARKTTRTIPVVLLHRADPTR